MTAFLRWTLIVTGGLVLAAATGLVGAWAHPDDALVNGLAFALTTLPVFLGLVYVVLAPKDDLPEHPEDNVETEWLHRASSGAFFDVVTVLGLAVAAEAILDVGPVPLVLVLVLAMADGVVRYVVLSRREA